MPNHLQHETSPYLLQHAENPVDWYPWGEEAFQRAREEDKPVFLSIGYSACHWCHVMAHESFEDPETAELLNRWFISVKVDREERPDLDSVYMAVCQAFTGGGGWPASVFLTPEELIRLLGPERGETFNRHFDVTEAGNFEGKSIPNLLQSDPDDRSIDPLLEQVYQYRKSRCSLHLDDKILTAWNGLMIAALCRLYQSGGNQTYLDAAKRANRFLWENLWDGGALYVSFRAERRGEKGFLDDYAACIFAQLALYGTTLERSYLERAEQLCRVTCERFQDPKHSGFYLYSEEHETLILGPRRPMTGRHPAETP